MNFSDRRLLMQKHGLTSEEVSKVFSMVRSGKFTIDDAVRYAKKDRKQ